LRTEPVKRALEFGAEEGEVALDAVGAADHDVIRSGHSAHRHDLARKRTEAPLHAVADDCAADLLGHREADADGRIAIFAIANEQDETGRGRPFAGVCGNEVRALADRD
jgi:hypothetical protein